MTFPTYSEYKGSGFEWIGQVPEHWQIKALRYLTICLDGKRIPLNGEQRADKQGDVPYWGANAIMDFVDEAIFDEELLLVGEDGAPFLDPFKPVAFHSSGPVWPNNHIHVLRPNRREWVRFLVYAMNAADYANFIEGSTRQKLNQSRLMGMPICWPSYAEQTQIARFLDHETARIDALIEEQQRLIELLKEKRQAVISHAVTKGLDPTVPMKDSGVEWLGEVPAHWDVKALRYLGECQNGINIGGEAFGSGSPFVSYGDVYKNHVLPGEVAGLVQSSPEDRQRYSVKAGDVLFTRTSETVDEIGFSSTCLNSIENATFAGFLIRFRPVGESLSPQFSKYYFRNQGLRIFFNKEMNLVTRASLSQDLLKLLPTTVPPLSEQEKIAGFLDSITETFASLLEQGLRSIELLTERRSALISAAVTGKINVRGWQPPIAASDAQYGSLKPNLAPAMDNKEC